MTGLLRRLLSKERDLRMVWELEKAGRRSRLIGTAHFFPYHFTGSFRRYIGQAETALFEGPLDDAATERVVESGFGAAEGFSLGDALDERTIGKINKEIGKPSAALSSHQLYRELFGGNRPALCVDLEGLRPWMAFYRIWARYLREHGWKYSMDRDASLIAAELGKNVVHLETIEEQIEALNGVPLERFVSFLKGMEWKKHRGEYVRRYLAGDLEGLVAAARRFPTFCESIIDKRDPVLYERMVSYVERGDAIAFVGVTHCRGITARFLQDGYRVAKVMV